MTQQIRWTPTRKKAALEDIATGRIDRAEFMKEHAMSEEEMATWEQGGVYQRGVKARVHRK